MKRRIYILGGVDLVGGQVSPADQQWLSDANSKPICIVDLTSNTKMQPKFRSIMQTHFSELTSSQLIFVSSLHSKDDVFNAIDNAGAIYIPGGDTKILLKNLMEQNLFNAIKSSSSPLIGSSAGAIAMCREAVITADADIKTTIVRDGLGVVPFSVDPHYDQTNDEELFELSKNREIYGLPEQSAIIVEGTSIEFVGPVWRFTDGHKQQVS